MRRMQPAARGVLVMFSISVSLLTYGALCLFTDIGIGGKVTGWILGGLGLFMLLMTIIAYVETARFNAQRKAGWKTIDIRVALDHARGEREKTLVDTADGQWRIALLNYPLELRDKIERDRQVQYIGELAHKKTVVVRPIGEQVEFLGYARSIASLRARQ